MIKRFIKDSAIYGSAMVMSQGIEVLLVPFYTRLLTSSEIGVIEIMAIINAIAHPLVTIEVNQGLARYIVETESEKERSLLSSTAMAFMLMASSAFVIIAITMADSFKQGFFDNQVLTYTIQVALTVTFTRGLFTFLQNLLRWQFQPMQFMMVSIIYTVAFLSIAILSVWRLKTGVVGVFYGQIVGGLLASSYGLYFSRKSFKLSFCWDRLMKMLKFSGPLVPSSISVWFSVFLDKVAIKYIIGLAALGAYGVGYRFASVVFLLLFGVTMSLSPLIYKHHQNPQTPQKIEQIFRGFIFCALLLIMGIYLFASEALILFTTPEYYHLQYTIPVLACGILLARMYFFAPGLIIKKKTGTYATINIIGAGLNIILNYFLIKKIGLTGAAIATLITAGLSFYLHMVYSQRHYPVPHNWPKMGFSLTALGVLIISAQQLGIMEMSINFHAIFFKAILLLLGVLFLIKILFSMDELKLVYKSLVGYVQQKTP